MAWLGNIIAVLTEWAWVLLACAACLALAASFFANLLPFPALRSYGGALLVGGIVLACAASNIQGRASSSAHARLRETQRELAQARITAEHQTRVIARQKEAAAANDRALVEMAERILAADMQAEAAKAALAELERSDADVSDYLNRPVPPGLGRLLVQ